MRILLCSSTTLGPHLGSSKVYVEVAEGLRRRGWEPTLVGPEEVSGTNDRTDLRTQATRLRAYLLAVASRYDVIVWDDVSMAFSDAHLRNGALGYIAFDK